MLEGQILNWGGDRVDMANSLETRPPFLDHELVELAAKIPPELRIHDGVEKWVLREAMRHILPHSLYTREKFSFMAPPAHTTRTIEDNPLFALLNEFVSADAIEDVGLLNKEAFAQFVESYTTEADPAILTRQDIILNHIVGVHALKQLFTSEDTAHPQVNSCKQVVTV
jgi:asparagine synthase (glutamine-hydrolysing)